MARLHSTSELKSVTQCENFWRCSAEGSHVCCNPYHVCRVAALEVSASSTYKRREAPQPAHAEQESGHYYVQGSHDTTLSGGSIHDAYWCKLAYWEHRTRMRRLYSITEHFVHVFHDLPKASGFCLGLLGSEPRSQTVKRTQKKIGQGLILSHEEGEVWAYNHSKHPIFINSPTLTAVASCGQAVHKVLSGYAFKVFDAEKIANLSGCSSLGDGPSDPHSVRIDFAKGWGACYSRQLITSCPCWLEILQSTPK